MVGVEICKRMDLVEAFEWVGSVVGIPHCFQLGFDERPRLREYSVAPGPKGHAAASASSGLPVFAEEEHFFGPDQ